MLDILSATSSPAPDRIRTAPVLVTGSPRSGSTWIGNILSLAPDAGYIHEPFHKHCRNGICRVRFAHAFTYITRASEAPYREALADTLAWRYSLREELKDVRTPRDLGCLIRDWAYFETMRRRRARAILKDPLALFSAEWLADRFDMQVVVVIRHPAAFVASLRAANWHHFPFRILLAQKDLMEERLAPFRGEIEAAVRSMPDAIQAGALVWRIMHHHIYMLQQEHPDWHFVRHEDVSRDPIPAFRALFGELGLSFTDEVRAGLERHSNEQNPLSRISIFSHKRKTVRNSKENILSFKKRLAPAEIDRIWDLCAPLSRIFYRAADWPA